MILDILSLLPGRKRLTTSGWHSFNAVCCHHRGHRHDTKSRGGVMMENQEQWLYHCFNCGFSAKFEIGKPLSSHVKQLLSWTGNVSEDEISRYSIESLRATSSLQYLLTHQHTEKIKVDWPQIVLPDDFVSLTHSSPNHITSYIIDRGISLESYPFLFSENYESDTRQKCIIPFTYENMIVGYCYRFLDSKNPKYIHHHPTNYLFGLDLQHKSWDQVFVVEGVFDAISIDGVATLHDTISDTQIKILKQLNKSIIFVPDQDFTGLKVQTMQRVLDAGFKVSLPDWSEYTHIKIKDANDAVKALGKFQTVVALVENATTNYAKVEITRKKLISKLQNPNR